MNFVHTFMLKSNMSGSSALSPYGIVVAFFAGAAYSPPTCPACPDCPVGPPCHCSTGLPIVLVLVAFGFLLGVWAKSHLRRLTEFYSAIESVPTKGKDGGKGHWLGRVAE